MQHVKVFILSLWCWFRHGRHVQRKFVFLWLLSSYTYNST